MNPVVSVSQMRAIDAAAIGNDTVVGYFYMQKAGMGLFRAIRKMFPDSTTAGEIAIVCGKGNNGGDGFVIARLLLQEGYRVMCFSLAPLETLTGECLIASREFISRKGTLLHVDDIADFPPPVRFSLIIDALLGTGLRSDPHGLYAAVISLINSSGIPVLSVDTPSGLNNDTGIPGTPCIKATKTVAMGFAKPGHFFYPGKTYTGELVIEDLGYAEDIVYGVPHSLYMPDIGDLRKMLPPRKPAGNKHDHGIALISGGSPGMAGSLTMAAQAALRCGCGMLHCAFPESLLTILSVKLTEPVLHALPQTALGTCGKGAAAKIRELIKTMHALCLGPGFSTDTDSISVVKEVVGTCTIPVTLDADGINAYRDTPEALADHAGPLCITPHRGEWTRLFGALPQTPLEVIETIRTVAQKLDITILLKGNPTLVADPSGRVYLLPFGNSALAKAGTGDMLSGIITSLAAQGAPLTDAAILGAYLHGSAGTIASERLNEYSVTAPDVIDCIAPAISYLIAGQEGT